MTSRGGTAQGDQPNINDPAGTAGGGGQSTQPDPHVLMYLQALSLAIPSVSSTLAAQTTDHQTKTIAAKNNADALGQALQQQVGSYVKERTKLQQDIESLKATRKDVLATIDRNKAEFIEKKDDIRAANAKQLHAMRSQIDIMDRDRREALQWLRDRGTTLTHLASTEHQLGATKERHEEDLKVMNDGHEEEKRHMRDALIRRLRRVRDLMSSTTDDDDAAGMVDSASSVDSAALLVSNGPTAKQNEKMARAVSLYEREAKTVVASIQVLTAEVEESKRLLEEQRRHNERFVLRNASHVKTRSVLLDQVNEVQQRYVQAEKRLHEDVLLRKQTMTDTANSQSEILFHLQGELDFAIGEHERAQTKVRLLRKEQQKRGGAAVEANKFFTETAMLLMQQQQDQPSSGLRGVGKANSSLPAPSAFGSSGGGGGGPSSLLVSDRSVPNEKYHESIPALLLSEPQEIASFFSAALCSMPASSA